MSKIQVRRAPSFSELRQAAFEWYDRTNGGKRMPPKPPQGVAERIIVNYVRHELTNYDQLKRQVRWQADERAVTELKIAVLDRIAQVHRPLAAECGIQIDLAKQAWL